MTEYKGGEGNMVMPENGQQNFAAYPANASEQTANMGKLLAQRTEAEAPYWRDAREFPNAAAAMAAIEEVK